MSSITTHILDTTLGRPAANVRIELERETSGWVALGEGTTDADGRAKSLMSAQQLEKGTYRLRFHVGSYFEQMGRDAFYPYVEIVFQVREPAEHYHVPLLLNPFGYSTYRGS
jgi:5-hydroxyisourate hydrolase